MILVVADTGPLHYLILIEAVGLLSRLFDKLVLPEAVFAELTHANAPSAVKQWASHLPQWVEVKKPFRNYRGVPLDPGESEAIALAEEIRAAALLLDEAEARQEAFRRRLPVAGTIGILEKAAERELIDLGQAFQRLSQATFYVAPDLLREALRRDRVRKEAKRADQS